jgi:hypothetical protein
MEQTPICSICGIILTPMRDGEYFHELTDNECPASGSCCHLDKWKCSIIFTPNREKFEDIKAWLDDALKLMCNRKYDDAGVMIHHALDICNSIISIIKDELKEFINKPCSMQINCAHRTVCKYLPNYRGVGCYDVITQWPISVDKAELDEALFKRAYDELLILSKGESCDHDVNICWCNTFRVLEDLKQRLTKKG